MVGGGARERRGRKGGNKREGEEIGWGREREIETERETETETETDRKTETVT